MKSNLIKIFVAIILLIVKFALSVELNCYFSDHDDGYNCHVKGVYENNTEVTSITGNHLPSRSNKDVAVIFVESSANTEFLPINICKFFTNLVEFESFGKKLSEISRDNFKECNKLNELIINFAKFSSLPHDLLYDTPNLTILSISNTNLKVVPAKFFDNTHKLTKIDLSNNLLLRIDAIFPPSVKVVNLLGNECVNKNYTSIKDEIYEECGSQSLYDRFIDLQASLNATSQQIDRLKESIDKNNLTYNDELTRIKNKIDNDILAKLKNIDNNLQQQVESNTNVQEEIRKIDQRMFDMKADIKNLESFNEAVNTTANDERLKLVEMEMKLNKFEDNLESKVELNEIILYVMGIIVTISLILFILAVVTIRKKNARKISNILMENYE